MDLENNKRIRLQRDIENQRQIDSWLKKDPSFKEKLIKLGVIDEQSKVVSGIWIPQLEFTMPIATLEREKITPNTGIAQELKQRNETITYQHLEIGDLEKTIVDLARRQAKNEQSPHIRCDTHSEREDRHTPEPVLVSRQTETLWQEALDKANTLGEKQALYAILARAQGQSWKEIGRHFGKTARTAARWLENGRGETLEHSPIENIPHIFRCNAIDSSIAKNGRDIFNRRML